MSSILQLIDLFAQPAHIYINKRSTISSDFGGIFTICMFISISIFSWFIGNDIIYKLSPFSYQEEQVSQSFPTFFINGTSFPFALAVMDFNSLPLQGLTYFQINLTVITTAVQDDGTTVTNYTPIELEPCEYRHFSSLTVQGFDNAGLEQCLCAKNQSITLEGGWGEQKIEYLNMATSMCNYTAYPDWCKSNQEIQDFISQNGINMNLYFIDASVSLVNLTHPLQFYVKNLYKYFDTTKYKTCEYALQEDKIVTDYGWLVEDTRENRFFNLQDLQCDTTNFNSNTKELLSLLLYSSNKIKIYHRKYIKISDILASTGGLMQLFFVAFKILNIPFLDVKKFSTMIKEIYYVNDKVSFQATPPPRILNNPYSTHLQAIPKNNPRVSTTNIIASVHNNHKITQLQLLEDNPVLQNLNTDNNATCQEDTVFNRSDTMKIICQRLCRSHYSRHSIKKIAFYDNAKIKIQHYFDFINIILKLEEYEKFKRLILDDTQNFILKLNSKIRLTKERKQSQNDVKFDKTELEKHAKAFCKRFTDGRVNEIDEKLAKLVKWNLI